MLNVFARASFQRLLRPLGAALARAGVSADAVTVVGTVGAVAGSVGLFGTGHLFAGTMVVSVFVLFDLVDGALARARAQTSVFGAVLDSTCDRVADAAIFASLAWWYAGAGDSRALELASLLCLVLGVVTSYIKARAEGAGLTCNVGIAERAERLIVILIGTGFAGIGVPYILAVALWLLVAATAVTVGQRVAEVRRQAIAQAKARTGAA